MEMLQCFLKLLLCHELMSPQVSRVKGVGQNTRPRLGRHYKLHSKGYEYWEGPLIQLIYHGAPSRKEKWACVDQGSDCKSSNTQAAL